MVRSMTGYGRFESDASGRNISVELKSVNHRYFEFSCRLPSSMGFLEEKLKSFLSPDKREALSPEGGGEE